MARSYRDVETADIPTDPAMKASAEAALSILQARGDSAAPSSTDHNAGLAREWRSACVGGRGTRFSLSCTGPTLPTAIPAVVIRPGDIARDRPFAGTWRLVVRAPILVLDLYWSEGKPLRIMTYANGDWQQELEDLGRPQGNRDGPG